MSSIYQNHFECGWYNRGWKSLFPLVYHSRKKGLTYVQYQIAGWWLFWRFYWVFYTTK